jgi:hypothetical protein
VKVEDIKQARDTVRDEVRFPQWGPDEHPGKKIEALEAYIGVTAVRRAELLAAQDWIIVARRDLQDAWDGVEGHEAALPRQATNEQVNAAKRRLKPDVWAGLTEAKELLASIERQVRRLERDYDAASRTYTLITGTA